MTCASTSARKSAAARTRSASRMVCCSPAVPALVGLVEGLHHLFEDGLHPRPPLVPQALGDAHDGIGGAVAVGEDAGVQQVDAGRSPLVGQVDEAHLVYQGLRHVLQQAAHQVGVGVDDDDGVSVPARSLLLELVADDVLHECGLAHAGAGDVKVVSSQQVGGEVNLPGCSGGGVADVGAAADVADGGQQHLRPGTGHQGRLVPRSGRVPQAGRLADAHDAALVEESGAGRVEHGGVGHGGPHAARLQVRPCGVVVVAVGRRHRLKQLLRPVLAWCPGAGWPSPESRRRRRCARPSP